MDKPNSQELIRALGRWTLTGLIINSIVGSGIFGLPSVVAGYTGQKSPLAYVFAAAGMAVIIACFAEVASRFSQAGGPYLYAREAFGRLAGLEVGWLLWLVRLTAAAAGANLFISYLAEFWPAAEQALPRLAVLSALIGFLALVNYRGVRSGALVSNIFTIGKLVPLVALVTGGGVFLWWTETPAAMVSSAPAVPLHNWLEAVLVLVFAYGGFEGALVPMAEAKNPRRDAPFALFTALAATTVLYVAIQAVVVAVLPDAALQSRPLAAVASRIWGRPGAILISAGALISIYGYLGAQMLHTPRIPFAFGERGDFPAAFARIHARFRTPSVSILMFAGLVWTLAVIGNFRWNVVISSAGRLFIYGAVCASLPVLRRAHSAAPSWRLPAGTAFAVAGVAFMLILVGRMRPGEWAVVAGTMAVALANWLWARNRKQTA